MSFIELGRYRMETWYFSPFPKEYYADGVVETVRGCMCACVSVCLSVFVRTLSSPPGGLVAHGVASRTWLRAPTHHPVFPATVRSPCLQMFMCEFCLKFFVHKAEHVWHLQKCVRRVSAPHSPSRLS